MRDVPLVFFVFSFLFAIGLAVPVVEHANDQAASTVPDSNTTTVSILEEDMFKDKDTALEHTSTVKKTTALRDRLLNRIKERSVLKIIRKYKKPRYTFHNSVLDKHFFSVLGQNVSSGTLSFHEKYNPELQPYDNSIIDLLIKPTQKLYKNMTLMTNALNTDKRNDFINTYLPMKSLANSSDIEIVRNTILRVNSLRNENETKTFRRHNYLHEKDESHTRKGIHRVRKYFKIHNTKVNELQESSKLI